MEHLFECVFQLSQVCLNHWTLPGGKLAKALHRLPHHHYPTNFKLHRRVKHTHAHTHARTNYHTSTRAITHEKLGCTYIYTSIASQRPRRIVMQSVLKCRQGLGESQWHRRPAEGDGKATDEGCARVKGAVREDEALSAKHSYAPTAREGFLCGDGRRSRGSEQRSRSQQGHGTLNKSARISH